jgi:hypothetical protein
MLNDNKKSKRNDGSDEEVDRGMTYGGILLDNVVAALFVVVLFFVINPTFFKNKSRAPVTLPAGYTNS